MLIPMKDSDGYSHEQVYPVYRQLGYRSQDAFMKEWNELSDIEKFELVEGAAQQPGPLFQVAR